jgi:hypothetical protein
MPMSSTGLSLLMACQPLLGRLARDQAVIERLQTQMAKVAWAQTRGSRPTQRVAVGERKTRRTNRNLCTCYWSVFIYGTLCSVHKAPFHSISGTHSRNLGPGLLASCRLHEHPLQNSCRSGK